MERRGGGLIRNEGEAECLRVVEAGGTTLTAHKMGRYPDGAELEKFERSEHHPSSEFALWGRRSCDLVVHEKTNARSDERAFAGSRRIGSLGERLQPAAEDFDIHFGAGDGCARFREPDFRLHEVFFELRDFVGRLPAARSAGGRKFGGTIVHT
jgi:hypothetical protein